VLDGVAGCSSDEGGDDVGGVPVQAGAGPTYLVERTVVRGPAWLVGAPFEDTAAALRLVLSGVPAPFPRLKFIVPHLGGTIPFLLARVSRKSTDEIRSGLRAMYYDTVSGSAEVLASGSRVYGTSRLLFGTDYPYCDEPQFRHHLSYLSEAGLDADELDQITGGTAAALLRAAGLPAG
jgi:6-methylsalicylate decarboxylase